MQAIDLGYGQSGLRLEYDESRFAVLSGEMPPAPLTDVELGECLDRPIGSAALEDVVGPGENVLFVVPDATRRSGAGQVVNLLVRRLIAAGTMPHEIAFLIATGIHRPPTEEEKREVLTPFIVQRLKVYEHRARDLMKTAGLDATHLTDHGSTSTGVRVQLNSKLTEFDRVVAVGGVSFHYFAGFTGGRKLVCPGVASEETIAATHRLAFDFDRLGRREGVGPGRLRGNAVHEAFVEVASRRAPDFAVNSIVDHRGEITDLFCGDWIESHERACSVYAERNSVSVDARRDVVVVSCGGSPHDINVIQAHKALDSAAAVCREGGRIVLIAECADGLGRKDFLEWFDAGDSKAMAERLGESYQVNGQTAWALREKTERFDVRIVTGLDAPTVSRMGMHKETSLQATLEDLAPAATGYLMPFGPQTLCSVTAG